MESILVEHALTRLSLAVSLVDDYSDGQAIGEIKLTMGGKEAIRNPGAYHLLLDFADGDYTLKAEARYYYEQEVDVTLPLPGEPVVVLTLKPTPDYPFPATATLVRGIVKDNAEKPVSGAIAKIIEKDLENQTSEMGEFVLYFKSLTAQDIIRVNGKKYIKAHGGSHQLQLQVTHPDYKKKTVAVEVEEGKTTSVFITLKSKGG